MKSLALLFLVSLFFSNYAFAADSAGSEREQSNSKISQILLKWQTSENPEEFAKKNGLLYRDNTIQVYIHLNSEEFISQIPYEINVVASDQKIAVAYVTPQQLDIFANLDFVDRVTLPDLARTPPIPQIATPEKPQEETSDFTPFVIITILVVIITIIAIFLKRKKIKTGR